MAALTEITGDFGAGGAIGIEDSCYAGTDLSRHDGQHHAGGADGRRLDVSGETNITASKQRIVELTLDPPNPPRCRRRWKRSSAPT